MQAYNIIKSGKQIRYGDKFMRGGVYKIILHFNVNGNSSQKFQVNFSSPALRYQHPLPPPPLTLPSHLSIEQTYNTVFGMTLGTTAPMRATKFKKTHFDSQSLHRLNKKRPTSHRKSHMLYCYSSYLQQPENFSLINMPIKPRYIIKITSFIGQCRECCCFPQRKCRTKEPV